ncbi:MULTISPECIES: InlB B-repeat-containing protein [unclassified Bilifractor]|uniref:InlB B-repeat-containing protein n=1 Tax=unclassified Bilifractor TaxID=2815795 RepID=UPI003F910880
MKKKVLSILMIIIVTVSLGVTSLPVHADDSANSESTSQTNLGRDTESVEEQSDTSDRSENDQVDKDASDNGDSTELDTTEPAAAAQEASLSESVDQPETPASQSTQPETSQDNKILNPIIRRIIRPSDTKTAVYRFYNGDQLVSEQTVKAGDTLLEPEAPVKVDETFTGWYAKDSDEKFDGFGTVGDITEDGQSYDYYARFSANTVYVYYYDQYDNLIDTVTAQQDTDIKISENMPMIQVEPLTQHHEGWHLEGSTEDVSGEYRVGTESVKLYPILKEGYWVNYDSNGGSSIASQFIDRNASPDQKKASQPSVIPAKEGYTFEGWYSDKELTNKYLKLPTLKRCVEP